MAQAFAAWLSFSDFREIGPLMFLLMNSTIRGTISFLKREPLKTP
jgi:hypothetical protein